MKTFVTQCSALLLFVALTSAAEASLVTQFNKTTNDGVYTLSAADAIALGVPSADRVGFFRVREGNGTTFEVGDTFNAASIMNSITSNAGAVLGLFNGTNGDLGYTGGTFAPLGTTVLGAADSYYEGVMFAFANSSGNIVFRGSSTFNGGQTRGDFPYSLTPVPEATSLCVWGGMILVGGLVARRRLFQAS